MTRNILIAAMIAFSLTLVPAFALTWKMIESQEVVNDGASKVTNIFSMIFAIVAIGLSGFGLYMYKVKDTGTNPFIYAMISIMIIISILVISASGLAVDMINNPSKTTDGKLYDFGRLRYISYIFEVISLGPIGIAVYKSGE